MAPFISSGVEGEKQGETDDFLVPPRMIKVAEEAKISQFWLLIPTPRDAAGSEVREPSRLNLLVRVHDRRQVDLAGRDRLLQYGKHPSQTDMSQ
jgi:hypothetical protein